MYLHEYKTPEGTFYIFTSGPAKPEGSTNLTPANYQGHATGEKVSQALKRIHEVFEEAPETKEAPKKEETKETPKEDSKDKKASVPDMIRALAGQIDKDEQNNA